MDNAERQIGFFSRPSPRGLLSRFRGVRPVLPLVLNPLLNRLIVLTVNSVCVHVRCHPHRRMAQPLGDHREGYSVGEHV